MDCPICQAQVPEGGTWCLQCGAAVNTVKGEGEDAPPSLDEAQRLRHEGLYREAIAQYKSLADAAPAVEEKVEILEMLGDTFSEKGDLRGAIKIYRDAIQLHPTDSLRQKYDESIDRMQAKTPPPELSRRRPASAPPPVSVAAPMAKPSAEEMELTGMEALRKQLTPRLAALIAGTALMAILTSLLFAAKPWLQPRAVPTHSIMINDDHPTVRTNPVPTNPTAVLPGMTGSTSSTDPASQPSVPSVTTAPRGKTLHHTKTKSSPAPAMPPAGGGTP